MVGWGDGIKKLPPWWGKRCSSRCQCFFLLLCTSCTVMALCTIIMCNVNWIIVPYLLMIGVCNNNRMAS